MRTNMNGPEQLAAVSGFWSGTNKQCDYLQFA